MDNNLSWQDHIQMVSNKLSKVISIFNRLKHLYPQQTLLTIYKTLFMSHIHYGLLLWGVKIENICKIQKKAIRIITNGHFTAHSEPLLKELNLLKIQDVFYLKLLFYYNLSYTLLPSYFESYLEIINSDQRPHYGLRSDARPLIRVTKNISYIC